VEKTTMVIGSTIILGGRLVKEILLSYGMIIGYIGTI